MSNDDAPRSLRNPDVRARRRTMLDMPHISSLTAFTATLRDNGLGEVPEFDPLDGGIDAQLLFLFEKPGPMTAAEGKRAGSGFISRNNDDATAEATFGFMKQARIPRHLTITWNVIPWWNGTVSLTKNELENGVASLTNLISLLPKLKGIILVGRKAASAQELLRGTGLPLFTSDHPSPRVRAAFPERWKAIPEKWSEAAQQLQLTSHDL